MKKKPKTSAFDGKMVSTSLLYLGLNGEQQQAQQPMCKQKKEQLIKLGHSKYFIYSQRIFHSYHFIMK